MRRLLASILDTTRSPWRWWSDNHSAAPTLVQRSSGLSDPYTIPASDGAESARLIVPLVIEANRMAILPVKDVTPVPLRMRSAPNDRRQTVISGRMSEVCELLDRLVADQGAGLDPVLH